MQLKQFFQDFLSLFIPERISLEDGIATITYLSKVIETQNLSDMTEFTFETGWPYWSFKGIHVITNSQLSKDIGNKKVLYDHNQIGFKPLLKEVILLANLTPEEVSTFSKYGYPPSGFKWKRKD